MHEDLNLPHPDHWISEEDGYLQLHDPFDGDLSPIDPDKPSEFFFDERLTDGMEYFRAVTGRRALALDLYFTEGEQQRSDFGEQPGYFAKLAERPDIYAMGHTMPLTSQAREENHAGETSALGFSDYRNEYHQYFHETVAGRKLLFYAGIESRNVYGGPAGPTEEKLVAMRHLVRHYAAQDHDGSYVLDITARTFEQWYIVANTGARLYDLHARDAGHDLSYTGLALATPLRNYDLIRKFVASGIDLYEDREDSGLSATAARNPYSNEFATFMTAEELEDTRAIQKARIPFDN